MVYSSELSNPTETNVYAVIYNMKYKTFVGTQAGLARIVKVSVSTLKRTIDSLVSKGLIRKNVVALDRAGHWGIVLSVLRDTVMDDDDTDLDYETIAMEDSIFD